MLDINHIRANQTATIKGLEKKNVSNAAEKIAQLLSIDADRRSTQLAMDNATATMKKHSQQIGLLISAGKDNEAQDIRKKTTDLKESIKSLSQALKLHESALQDALYQIPNLPHQDVPLGTGAADNVIIYQSDLAEKNIENQTTPHWELAKQYGIIDFELGNKLTGAGFPVYLGKGARLQRALINFFLDEAQEAGYEEVQPPIIINEASGYGTGQLPDKEGQMYQLTDERFYLIPTAEVPLTNLYRDEIVAMDQLPIKNVAYTPCFRREAGSWGSHVRGLNRLHQFDKVEIVQVSTPETSYDYLHEMLAHTRQLLEKLNLPYRVLKLCGGDLGFTAALTYDLEVWSAGQKRWLEVSSVSNFETYQAQRLQLRYRDKHKKLQLLHTLNGSALALPRVMAALLENNQTANGISIPKALQAYTGFDSIG